MKTTGYARGSKKAMPIPTYRNGGAIVWSAAVSDADKYTQERTVSTANATTVAYTQAIGFDLTANWDDSGNDDAVRPEGVTVDVYGDGRKLGSVAMSGEGDTWTGNIGGLPVWRAGDPDAAVQYTFRWDDATEKHLADNGYEAVPTRGGEPAGTGRYYWLSTEAQGRGHVGPTPRHGAVPFGKGGRPAYRTARGGQVNFTSAIF